MIRIVIIAVLVIVAGVAAWGGYNWSTDPGRKTTAPVTEGLAGTFIDGALHYPSDPAAKISFTPDFEYVGGHKFVLQGAANVEQHFFVATYPDGRLKSTIWLQFEEVRPGVDWQYDYSSSPLRTKIGEFDFFTDTLAGSRHPLVEYGLPGGDGYPARKYIGDRGYRLPKNFAYARQVHLPTEDRRKELIVIVMDDLAPTGFTARDLKPGGVHEVEWPAISEELLAKIERVMTMTPLN